MLPMPGVSVCIPLQDGERFLAEAITSVLDQTHRDFELVVLDNADSDAGWDVARSFAEKDPRVRVERNGSPVPQAENWNLVVQLSRAPLVKLLVADDLLHPRCLELQVGPMEVDPGLAVVAARRHLVDEQSRVIVPRRGLSHLVGVRTGVEVARRVVRSGANPIGAPGAVLFRRADFFAAGGWRVDGGRTNVVDLDLWMRLLQHGDFLGLPETLAASRIGRTPGWAENAEAVQVEQRMLLDELGGSDGYQVRKADLAVGRLLGPVRRLRRRALFAFSGGHAGRSKRDAGAHAA